MREVRNESFNTDEYTDVNFLYSEQLVDIPSLNKNITYLQGKDDSAFPLMFTTKGNNAISKQKPKALNDTQYTWDIMGRIRLTSKVVGLISNTDSEVGLGGTPFEVEFEDSWFIKDHGAMTPNGKHQVRIQGKGSKPNSYIMTISGSADSYIPASEFVAGLNWVMTAPAVSVSKSDGNSTNRQTPAKMTNQYSVYRYSMNIAGNISNKITTYNFDTEGGGTTKLWIPEEIRQFNYKNALMNEHECWYSEYNRDAYGNVTLIDNTTNEVVPKGAGVKQILTDAGQYSTYTTLTLDKINSIVNRIYTNYIGYNQPEIILYTGDGGIREFHNAIMNDANGKDYFTALSEAEIKQKGSFLEYGNYFRSYRTIDNRIVTVVNTNFFNHGLKAQMDKQNGNMINGFPLESYNMVYLDQSADENGQRNVQMVVEEGREYIAKIYAGMANLPKQWLEMAPSFGNGMISTTRDIASFETLETFGINMLQANTSYWLEKDYQA